MEKNRKEEDEEKAGKKETEEEKNLEELAQDFEIENRATDFSDFISSARTEKEEAVTPTIISNSAVSEADAETSENLEQATRDAHIVEQTATESNYISVYNKPDYSGSMNEQTISLRNLEEKNIMVRNIGEIKEGPIQVRIEPNPEVLRIEGELNGTESRLREYIPEVSRRDESEKLPFQKEKKYKELKRGRS